MAKTIILKDPITKETQYPTTLASLVYDENGNAITSSLPTTDAREFLMQEYEKTLSLIDEVSTTNEYISNKGIIGSSTKSLLTDYVSIDASKGALMLNSNGTCDYEERAICFYDTSKSFISGVNYKGLNYSFVIPNNASYFRLAYQKTLSVSVSYYGHIVHQKDVDGVLLWKNGSPNANLSSATITLLQGISGFSKLVIYAKHYVGSSAPLRYEFSLLYGDTRFPLFSTYASSTETFVQYRAIAQESDTTLKIDVARYNTAQADDRLVPIEIYGIK